MKAVLPKPPWVLPYSLLNILLLTQKSNSSSYLAMSLLAKIFDGPEFCQASLRCHPKCKHSTFHYYSPVFSRQNAWCAHIPGKWRRYCWEEQGLQIPQISELLLSETSKIIPLCIYIAHLQNTYNNSLMGTILPTIPSPVLNLPSL